MKNKIFKYNLRVKDVRVVEMPKDAQILTVQNQYGKLVMWANVCLKNKLQYYVFEIYGTGQDIPSAEMSERKYISTVQIGELMWHIFQII